jgi:hypothetical protein
MKGMKIGSFAASLLTALMFSVAIRAQNQAAIAPLSDPNTSAGLQQMLETMFLSAKNNDLQKLTDMVKATEVPNCSSWLHAMYEADKADSWMGLCDSKILGSKEKSFEELMRNLSKTDGDIIIRKVNDDPEPGHGMEWGWLQSIKQPLDIYFASWKTLKDSKGEPLGYFMFIDGGFRWDSTIESFKMSTIKRANIVMPKLIKKVDPIYPPGAATNHISGTVRVYFVIGSDGIVHVSPHANKEEGFSDDSNLVKAAEDAVRQWTYLPLTVDGKPGSIDFHADIVFAP